MSLLKKKRILLSAYACSPYRGSDQGVGWNRAFECAKYFDTYVICREEKYKDDIQKYLSTIDEVHNLHFFFVPMGKFLYTVRKIPGLFYFTYNLWQRKAFRFAKKLCIKYDIEIVNHVTTTSYREPGYLWKLNIPFVWGSIGGTQNYPWKFLPFAGITGAIKEGFRNIINFLQFRFSPRVRKVTRKAALILVANSSVKRHFYKAHRINTIVKLERGVSTINGKPHQFSKETQPLKILWSGVLNNHKALHLLLLSLENSSNNFNFRLRILGSGPLENKLKKLAIKLNVNCQCEWMGWIPFEEVRVHYNWTDIFVFTSLRDTSGGVVLEALSYGVPVVCFDHQGVGDIVNQECGIKIPLSNPKNVIENLKKVLSDFASQRDRLQELSKGAKKRAREFDWQLHGKEISKLFLNAIQTRKK